MRLSRTRRHVRPLLASVVLTGTVVLGSDALAQTSTTSSTSTTIPSTSIPSTSTTAPASTTTTIPEVFPPAGTCIDVGGLRRCAIDAEPAPATPAPPAQASSGRPLALTG